jgi:hypothetical protein
MTCASGTTDRRDEVVAIAALWQVSAMMTTRLARSVSRSAISTCRIGTAVPGMSSGSVS